MSRYRQSATYIEALSWLVPTVHVTGIDSLSWEKFIEINGRDYVALGGVNVWPSENVKIDISASENTLQQFTTYFSDNEKKIRAQGGVFPNDDQRVRTATEFIGEISQNVAILTPIVDSIESSLLRIMLYCGMFEGIYTQEEIETNIDDITISIPRDFAIRKLTVEEAREIESMVLSGILPKDEALRLLEKGGWTISSADEIMMMLDNAT